MNAVSHIIKGEEFLLLPEKGIYWAKEKALLIADLHLGKITHFRKAGIGLPLSAEIENVERLSTLILTYPVDKIYILGDLFHSHYNEQWVVFKSFISRFPEHSFVLIRGNHDILNDLSYKANNLTMYEETLEVGPFIYTHIPLETPHKLYNICGHIHPGVVLKGKGLQSMKLPCFHFGKNCLVLPAFGTFTGTARINAAKEDSIYAISDTSVIKVL